MNDFVPMVDVIPPGKRGSVEIQHFSIGENEAKFHNLQALFAGQHFMSVDPGKYCRLIVDNEVMMSDTPHEQSSCWDIVYQAKGDVLIAGLGIGMVLLPLLFKPEVQSVTVVEIDGNVLNLVEPHIRVYKQNEQTAKLYIEPYSIFDWHPPKGQKYDAIWFDIWPEICGDNLPEIAQLHQRGKYWKRNMDSFMSSWMVEFLRDERKRYGF